MYPYYSPSDPRRKIIARVTIGTFTVCDIFGGMWYRFLEVASGDLAQVAVYHYVKETPEHFQRLAAI